jgi:addiction module HigA family antidote
MYPRNLWPIAVRKLNRMDSVVTLHDLRILPGNQLEALGGTGAVDPAFESTSGTASALSGRKGVPHRWKLLTITNWEPSYTMIRVPTHREPTHSGEVLVEEFLKPLGLTQRDLAQGIYVPYQRVNELVNRRRGLTPSTALRLAGYFGTSPDFWMNLQLRWDLYHTQKAEARELKRLRGLRL